VGIKTCSRDAGCCVSVLVINGVRVGAEDKLEVSVGVFDVTNGVVAVQGRS
jgi:hypothetical protein